MRFCCCPNRREGRSPDELPQAGLTSSRRLLIFLNPKSGAGNAPTIFKTKLHPALFAHRIGYELIVTEAPNHAAELVRTRGDLFNFHAVVIVSGDGLVFEVVNAMLQRPDSVNLLGRLPLAIIPCGSGNGLLSSVFAHSGKETSTGIFLENAIDALTNLNAVSKPVNLVRCSLHHDGHLGSFLSCGWGLLADIDIESESLRPMCGGNRFFWGALWRSFFLKTYHAKLSYLEAESADLAVFIDEQPVYIESSQTLPRGQTNAHSDHWTEKLVTEVPHISHPPPPKWKTIEDEFVMVYAVSLSHISNTNVYAPNAQLREPQLHLTYILKRDIKSKANVVKFLTAIESQDHLDLPFCHHIRASAFRLEPLHHKNLRHSPIVIDGEVVKTDRIQCVVSDLCLRVLS